MHVGYSSSLELYKDYIVDWSHTIGAVSVGGQTLGSLGGFGVLKGPHSS